jgi:hypothetical protein
MSSLFCGPSPNVSIETEIVLVAASGLGDSMTPPHPKNARMIVANAELRVILMLRPMRSREQS